MVGFSAASAPPLASACLASACLASACLTGLGHQRAQAGVNGEHVSPGQRPGQHPVGLAQDVIDVLGGSGGFGAVARPLGVGGADDPPLAPRDEEEHALAGAHDHAGLGVDRGGVHDQVHALGHPDLVAGLHAARLVHQVRPDARADHGPGRRDVESPPGLLVPYPRAGHPLAVPQQRHRAGPGDDGRAVQRRRPRHRDRVPRVVDLGVVVEHGAGQPLGPQRRGPAERAAGGQVPVMRDRPLDALHGVVDHQARAHVRPLDHLPVQRVEEGHRPDQVRREPADQQVTFPQRLLDELEVALLEVAEAAVDELARPARGARGQVAGLDQTDPQAAGRGVEGGPGAGYAAADDKHIERPRRQPPHRFVTITSIKNTGHRRLLLPGPVGGRHSPW